ncbi:MFS general substrate transporter [Glarea lozoyensis ATCC 20868]|uniref:MFS general substrate transporter n=1 Tax=Glarea lozoyensis (strain ATCC 20868 / MF5171) TaxID=1116229 RepID=S3E222_GLAL2|nr:MFS general substrate transporter [Glarea lozoyensis ATCC 20868]EPE32528.1 MFS general substrate transporter [Glarea lozoyensis ATCC 20868]
MASENELIRGKPQQITTASRVHHDDEEATSASLEFCVAPEGGLNAWLVAAGGSAIFFCCLGFSNSFGTFIEYYKTHQLKGNSPDSIAWIGSLSLFLQFAAGAFGGPLFDLFGSWSIRPAAVLYFFAIMMLSLCKTYWQFMLVQGILQGLVMGCLQFPAFAAVSQYFDKKRAVALGVVVSGSSIGGIIIPLVVSKLLNGSSLDFGWSIRIIGFLILPFMIFACVTVTARLPPRKSTFWLPKAFKEAKYLILIAALFFMFFGMFTPFYYLPTYAVTRGMNPTLAGYMLSIINATSTFGRILPALLADKYGRINMFSIGGIVCGITIFCMDLATNNTGLIIYSAVFGFASGTIISGASAAFSGCSNDSRNIGTYMGMGMAISALGGLVGPPINGLMVRQFEGFYEVSLLSGTMCLTGGLIALSAKMFTPEGLWGMV